MTTIMMIKNKKQTAGLKKANFRNFLSRDVQIKLFKSFHFKKNSTKKYSFSAKLLDVEVYYMLIVLITR